MTTNDILALGIECLFTALFVAAAWRFQQRRMRVDLYLTLMFGPLAALLVTRIVSLAGFEVPDLVSRGLVLFVLAQPVFALGLAAHLTDLPRAVAVGAVTAFAVTSVPLVLLATDAAAPLLIATIAVFATIEGVAAFAIHRSAGDRTGAARTRRQIVAWATVLLGVALVVAGGGSVAGADAGPDGPRDALVFVAQLVALASGLGYLVAMLPPGRLARAWQAVGAYPEVAELLARSGEESIWRQLVQGARHTSGATGVAIALPGADGPSVVASVGFDGRAVPRFIDRALEGLAASRRRADAGQRGWAEIPAGGDGAYALAIALDPDQEGSPFLALVWPHPLLFPEDERAMLGVLFRQAALMAERASLSRAHERLAIELRITVAELERASQAKSDFLAGMSHELRTPLNAILGFSDLMRGEVDPDGTLHVPPEWAEHIHRGGQHLLGLINDILDLSKVEAGRIDLQPSMLDLDATVSEAIEAIEPLSTRKHQEVASLVPAGLHVMADRARFRQVLYNLLSNAIRYTPDGGAIRVEAAETALGVLPSPLADPSVGIAPEDQARIFDAFWQARSATGRSDGTGLGLTLSRRLMEAHGGTLSVKSKVGEGSRFSAHFPARDPAEPSGTGVEAAESTLAGRQQVGGRILLVEDDASTVRLLRTYLEPGGYAIRVASSGEEALALAGTEHPDLILLDVLLPDMDGWDVLRRLKSDPATDDIPVVFESVVDEPGVGIALGAADYLLKPIDRRQLLASVARVVRPAPHDQRPRRVLAVDDEPVDLELVVTTLRAAGYDATGVTSGSEALGRAATSPPDVVLCDLIMPSPDGFEVISTLRDDPATSHIPILVLTAHDLTQQERERLSHRVVTVLAKTCERGELLDWVARVSAGVRA